MQDRLAALLHFGLSLAPAHEKQRRQWLQEVLAADPDAWRQQFRQAVTRADAELLARLVDQVDVAHEPSLFLVQVAWNPLLMNHPARLRMLRRAQQRHPNDYWLNLELADALYFSVIRRGKGEHTARKEELPVVSEAVGFARVAVGVRPGSPIACNYLGLALRGQGDLKGAIACFTRALDLDPKNARTHHNLGNTLQAQGNLAEAIACYKKAVDLNPTGPSLHYNLGTALAKQGDVARAIACYKKALDLKPRHALAHNNLGQALYHRGNIKGAIDCYRKALEIDPELAVVHNTLGLALTAQGDVKGAIACYTQALKLDPRYAQAHNNLGNARAAQGDGKGAIACYHKALDLDPRDARTHYNLGKALNAQGDLKGAITCYTQAIKLDPKLAEAHCNLGHALRAQGNFALALSALQRGHQLGSPRATWRYPSARWVDECQRLLDLDTRLPALLAGDEHPANAAEQLALADLCQRYKKRYAAAARFYQGAFAAGDAPTSQHGYNAACAAARAAAGQGEDASKLADKEKTRLRWQALAWLKDALHQHSQQLQTADAKSRQAMHQTLQQWQKAADLAGVRDEEALAQLPAAERTAWQQFWADVAALCRKAGAEPKDAASPAE
jgi:tetratricopeptide (TPR) repeat protein